MKGSANSNELFDLLELLTIKGVIMYVKRDPGRVLRT